MNRTHRTFPSSTNSPLRKKSLTVAPVACQDTFSVSVTLWFKVVVPEPTVPIIVNMEVPAGVPGLLHGIFLYVWLFN
jgi:hypothetical protein